MINNNSMKKNIKEMNNVFETKINVFKVIIYLAFFGILIKLFSMQVINRDYYLNKLNSKTTKIVYGDTTLRGRIYDTNHNLLVDNQLIMTITYQKVSGMSTSDEIELAYEISPYIELNYSKLTKSYLKDFFILTNEELIMERVSKEKELYNKRKITFNEFYTFQKESVIDDDLSIYTDDDKKAIYLYFLMNNGYSYEEKIIKEDCTINEFMYFSENNHNLNGFDTKYTYGRVYLYEDTLKGILGSVGNIPYEKKDYYLSKGYNLNDKVGLSSLEFIYDDLLKGKRDVYKIIDNERILVEEKEKGKDIVLTIDINTQRMVDNTLKDEVKKAKKSRNTKYYKHSYVMITDTFGEIIAMSGQEIINNKLYDVSIGNITDTITPGSVVKGASMLVGYDTGAIKIGEVFYDECLKIKSTPKKCSVYKMGNINDINALAFSSNVYQFKTAIRVGGGTYRYNESLKINSDAFDTYRNYFSSFGLGVNTGIELLNESRGYKGSNRDAGLLLDFAIGQYDTYTNIQLNQYISTIARDGKRYKMHLLKEVWDGDVLIEEIENKIINEVDIDKKYFERVKKGLSAVMDYGTGKNYVSKSIDASGKTGTSESFYDSDFDGKIDTPSTSTSFVMYMPSENPKYAISITSPNISDKSSGYKYPINQYVIKKITNNLK